MEYLEKYLEGKVDFTHRKARKIGKHHPLTQEQAALMNATLWFVHSKKQHKYYFLGEYIYLS